MNQLFRRRMPGVFTVQRDEDGLTLHLAVPVDVVVNAERNWPPRNSIAQAHVKFTYTCSKHLSLGLLNTGPLIPPHALLWHELRGMVNSARLGCWNRIVQETKGVIA